MTFLAPQFLLAAAAIVAGVIGVHFLVTRQPPSAPLPTARFIPASATTVVTAARRPHDLLLLLLRVLAVALIGVAFARPHLTARQATTVRFVVADRSRAVANIREVQDSVRKLLRPGDVLVAFDSVAHVIAPAHAADSATALRRSTAPGTLSTALIVASREVTRWRDRADSFELHIVSPVTTDEIDDGTQAVRALWGGRIHVARVSAAVDTVVPSVLEVRAAADDPVRATRVVRGTGANGGATVRLVRDAPTTADSAWARNEHGRALVVWPAVGVARLWGASGTIDTVGAVVIFRPVPIAVVASFARPWRLEAGDKARPIAVWVDGKPAAVERPLGAGCVRDVAIPLPSVGDLVLRPEFDHLANALLSPCGGDVRSATPLSAQELHTLEGNGPLFPARGIAVASAGTEPIVPWLLALALMLTLAELVVRHRRPRSAMAVT